MSIASRKVRSQPASNAAARRSDDSQTAGEASISIAQIGDRRFEIALGDETIEKLGESFRERPSQTSFTSILSLLGKTIGVALLTAGGAAFFQYVSWLNAERLQAATETATKAASAYRDAASAIGQRYYASFVIVDAIEDLNGKSDEAKNQLSAAVDKTSRARFDSYYAMLAAWNENYAHLLTEIDNRLDRPILSIVRPDQTDKPISWKSTDRVDCDQSLIAQVSAIGFPKQSLKAQLAVISGCYGKVHQAYSAIRNKALNGDAGAFDDAAVSDFRKKLSGAISMTNVFACFATRRINYYYTERGFAILSPHKILEWIFSKRHARAEAEIHGAEEECAILDAE
jgi:hypothetical protein